MTTEPGAAPGFAPQQLAEAEERLERYFAQRCNQRTADQNRRKWVRFLTFHSTRPAAADRRGGVAAQGAGREAAL